MFGRGNELNFLHSFGRNTDLLDEIDKIRTLNELNYFNFIELNGIALILKCQTHVVYLPRLAVLFFLSLMRHLTCDFDTYNVSPHVVNANETHVKAPGLHFSIQNMKQLFCTLIFGTMMLWKYE